MKKILIIGGSGFIGKNIKEYLLNNKSYIIDSPSHSELDVLNEQAVFNRLKSCFYDVVIHSGVYNPRLSNLVGEDEVEKNLHIFMNFYKYSNLFGKMIYFGSGAEYNKEYNIVSAEEGKFINGIPNNKYGFYKYVINELINNSKNIYNFRIFGLFGKYENWKKTFISGACCKAIYNLPLTIRQNCYFDYLYINDFLKIIDWSINVDLKKHEYNIVSGRKIDLVSIANIVNKISKKNLPIYVCKDGYANEYTASNERLINEYKDFSLTDIHESINDLYNYYLSIKDEIDIMSLLYQ